jgi:hypothetical protein
MRMKFTFVYAMQNRFPLGTGTSQSQLYSCLPVYKHMPAYIKAQPVYRRGSIPGRRKIYFYTLIHSVQTGSGTHSASYPVGTGWLFPREVKWPGREADHSPPCRYTSTPPYVFIAWCLIKQAQEQLYLYLHLFDMETEGSYETFV